MPMSDEPVQLRFLAWIHVASFCSRCGPDPEGLESCPAAVLATVHHTDAGPRLSLAAQVCSRCVELEGLAAWVAAVDPWDEASEGLEVEVPPEPILMSTHRIEPRCTRCRLMPVQIITVLELGDGTVSLAPIAHLCHPCRQDVARAVEPGGSEPLDN